MTKRRSTWKIMGYWFMVVFVWPAVLFGTIERFLRENRVAKQAAREQRKRSR